MPSHRATSRLARIRADQAALAASFRDIEERLRVHDAALADLDERLGAFEGRLRALELRRLKEGQPVLHCAVPGLKLATPGLAPLKGGGEPVALP
jgi:hypothetical protein